MRSIAIDALQPRLADLPPFDFFGSRRYEAHHHHHHHHRHHHHHHHHRHHELNKCRHRLRCSGSATYAYGFLNVELYVFLSQPFLASVFFLELLLENKRAPSPETPLKGAVNGTNVVVDLPSPHRRRGLPAEGSSRQVEGALRFSKRASFFFRFFL